MATNRRRPSVAAIQANSPPGAVVLSIPARERFAQDVAAGLPVTEAYKAAGYQGNARSRQELRAARDVDARIRWLLAERYESQNRSRSKNAAKEADARLRLIRELESLAYSDIRDVIQWDREPTFDKLGNVTGERTKVDITPSKHLTKEQAALVRSIQQTKFGAVKFETHPKIDALKALASILGLTGNDLPPGATITNNTQVNVAAVGDTPAIEIARRLAFILERAHQASPPAIESHAVEEERKE